MAVKLIIILSIIVILVYIGSIFAPDSGLNAYNKLILYLLSAVAIYNISTIYINSTQKKCNKLIDGSVTGGIKVLQPNVISNPVNPLINKDDEESITDPIIDSLQNAKIDSITQFAKILSGNIDTLSVIDNKTSQTEVKSSPGLPSTEITTKQIIEYWENKTNIKKPTITTQNSNNNFDKFLANSAPL